MQPLTNFQPSECISCSTLRIYGISLKIKLSLYKIITMKNFLSVFISALLFTSCQGQKNIQQAIDNNQRIIPGAERINIYLPLIKGKRVGIFANQTSIFQKTNHANFFLFIWNFQKINTRTRQFFRRNRPPTIRYFLIFFYKINLAQI